jgi:hypothetical protein
VAEYEEKKKNIIEKIEELEKQKESIEKNFEERLLFLNKT